jgi:hypothetical protein
MWLKNTSARLEATLHLGTVGQILHDTVLLVVDPRLSRVECLKVNEIDRNTPESGQCARSVRRVSIDIRAASGHRPLGRRAGNNNTNAFVSRNKTRVLTLFPGVP